LAGMRSRGGNCYLPIPFGSHLVVSASKGDFYYHCNVTTLAPGTNLPSFSLALLDAHRQQIERCRDRLAGSEPVRAIGIGRNELIRAPAIVKELRLHVARPEAGVDLGELLRRVLLVIRCGDEETVRVPVGDFFCGGADWKPWRGRLLGIGDDGTAFCRLPMPMPEGGEIRLEAAGDRETLDRLGLDLAVALGPWRGAADPLLFRASYHQKKNFDSRPFHDFTILDASGGAGRFVGCTLLVKNPSRGWWGEGDEKFFVDGETLPSTFGTGTEDYFGYAWCCPEPFCSAFHAQTQCDGPGNYGFTSLHRSQILDSVPFRHAFRFDLEVWHWVEGLKLDYASVAYWYGAPGATSGMPPVPPVAERALDRLPPAPVFVAAGVLEGESLRVAAMTGGSHEAQDMSFRENTFSRDGQRWWRDGKPGDTLVLAVPVEAAGDYRISAAFCMARDYGIVQLTLDDQKLGEPIDGYGEGVTSSGSRELGTCRLEAGEAMLRVTILGSNENAVPRHMFGLDYLRLERLP
ncbi:MAG: DUF2961 domain-containing protein, partial [Planctomycetes bacterium]|nr:DUF2961 domain-containing protein [Planctomycetota bacterium]